MSNIAAPDSIPLTTHDPAAEIAAVSAKILGRMEALPLSAWHLKARVIVGSATFFDAIDTVAIGMVLPVIGLAWHLTPGEIGWLISGGFLGQMIGAIGFGQLAERDRAHPDRHDYNGYFRAGRHCLGICRGVCEHVPATLSQGLGLGAEVPVAATYINEIAPANKRGRFVLLYEFIFAVGIVVSGFIGRWAIPAWGWQSIFLIGSIPPLLTLFFFACYPNRPAGWCAGGRIEEAGKAVSKIEQEIRASGKEIPLPKGTSLPAPAGSGSWAELFSPRYRTRTLLIWTIWVTVGFISWPLTIWLPSIYRNVFRVSLEEALNYGMINNVVILIATLSCALLIDYTGRKAWFTGAFILAGAALCILGFMGATTASSVFVLTALTLFGITSLNLAIYLYTPELYPTRLRAFGVGVALAWARVAGMIAPPIIGWGLANNGLPSVFLGLGVISLIAAIVTSLLAIETRKRILEEVSP